MSFRAAFLLLLAVPGVRAAAPNPLASFTQGSSLSESDAARLEGVLAANPEDVDARAQLLGYYNSVPVRDADWSNRMRLSGWMVEHHPESTSVLAHIWHGMPDALFQQLKPIWVAQVHQHADDPHVLSNAAAFLASRDAQPAASGIRVAANVAAANLISSVPPVYPPLAQMARVQGTVRFNLVIGKDGHVQNLTLISGHPLLIGAAQEALVQYTYKPTLLNGNPVEIVTTVDVNFSLNQ